MRASRAYFMLALSLIVLGTAGLIVTAGWSPSPATAGPAADSGWLGVMLRDLDRGTRAEFGVDRRIEGALVTRVLPDSPAESAGILEGDVIVEVDNRRVASMAEAVEAARALTPGDKVLVVVNRNGVSRGLTVHPGESGDRRFSFYGDGRDAPGVDQEVLKHFKGPHARKAPRAPKAPLVGKTPRAPEAPRVWSDDGEHRIVIRRGDDDDDEGVIIIGGDDDNGKQSWSWSSDDDEDDGDRRVEVRSRGHAGFLGVETRKLGGQLARYFDVDEDQGVLVSEVVKDSPAEKAGLAAGDVIIAVDGDEVGNSDDLRRLIRAHEPGETINLDIVRRGAQKRVEAQLGDVSDFSDTGWSDLHELLADKFHFDGDGPVRVMDLEIPDIPDIHIPEFDIEIHGLDPEEMQELREELQEQRLKLREHGIKIREHLDDEDGHIRIQIEEGMLKLQEHLEQMREHLQELHRDSGELRFERQGALQEAQRGYEQAQQHREQALEEARRALKQTQQYREQALEEARRERRPT